MFVLILNISSPLKSLNKSLPLGSLTELLQHLVAQQQQTPLLSLRPVQQWQRALLVLVRVLAGSAGGHQRRPPSHCVHHIVGEVGCI